MAGDDTGATALSQELDVHEDGSYKYSYETSNGIKTEESGVGGVSISGSAKWTDPDGTPVDFTYTADESGYHPVSSFLPVGPPVPEIILRAIKYIEDHPSKE